LQLAKIGHRDPAFRRALIDKWPIRKLILLGLAAPKKQQ
jgi:hypothetical protein